MIIHMVVYIHIYTTHTYVYIYIATHTHAYGRCSVQTVRMAGVMCLLHRYTHNLGAFSPSARSLGVAPADCPMFMTLG